MDEAGLLRVFLRQILNYQIVLAVSRVLGLFRDFLVVFFLGVGALSDQIFFILSIPDVIMTILVGGGAVLYLSDKYKKSREDGWGGGSLFFSALVFYMLLGVFLASLEFLLGYPMGRALFSSFDLYPQLSVAYLFVILSLLFSLPVVAANAVFLHREKMYLQPFLNVVFSIVLISWMAWCFFSGIDGVADIAMGVLVAAFVRFLFSYVLGRRLGGEGGTPVRMVPDLRFYSGLGVSGLSFGLIVLLPVIFKASLPSLEEGLYAIVTVVLKISDILAAFIVLPVVSLYLRRKDDFSYKDMLLVCFGSVGLAFLVCSFLVLASYSILYEWGWVSLTKAGGDAAVYSLWASVFITGAYVVSLCMVKIKMHNVSLFSSLVSVFYFICFSDVESGVFSYFLSLYVSLVLYALSSMGGFFFFKVVKSL